MADWTDILFSIVGLLITLALGIITAILTRSQAATAKIQSRTEIASSWEKDSKTASTALKEIRDWVRKNGGTVKSNGNVTGSADFAAAYYKLCMNGAVAPAISADYLKELRDVYRSFWICVKTNKVDRDFWIDLDYVWLHRARMFYNMVIPLDMARAKADWQKDADKAKADGKDYSESPEYKVHATLTFCMEQFTKYYPENDKLGGDGKVICAKDWVVLKSVWEGDQGGIAPKGHAKDIETRVKGGVKGGVVSVVEKIKKTALCSNEV